MPWLTLRLQVTTPLFNGAPDVGDTDGTGVRVPSVRGAMRWWFRALAGGLVGPDLELLWRLERKVFGGATTGDKGVPSPIRLRIPEQPSLTLANARHDFLPGPQATPRERSEHNGYWIVYLLGQGLGNLRECSLRRPYVAAGQEFDLKIDVGGGPHAALALASLWLTCAYGGVGSRIRRGFGGLRIIGSSGALPEPWTPQSILTPGLEHYTDLRHLWPKDPIVACMNPTSPSSSRNAGGPSRTRGGNHRRSRYSAGSTPPPGSAATPHSPRGTPCSATQASNYASSGEARSIPTSATHRA
ncbi:type III-B CRISPR module RAMP protein Cmr1 [Actinomadura sp. CNU-125]|uniref:type III-B CRISPR module RAMP protein Cmr1 n=1 Tax=Actinomadura sp. CNU-125 TaxID=1904961 RepID=UPI000963C13D|nr:type III-B CRISPR module RAMP protein Cmr1 [Actinomadura sp. CNU-125]OLT23352.1 type III-B CRISPR module RAMP protein Cmr1 [Actinomadura sp. CNU-125]